MDTNLASDRTNRDVRGLYDKLEDRCLMRDQVVPATSITISCAPAGR